MNIENPPLHLRIYEDNSPLKQYTYQLKTSNVHESSYANTSDGPTNLTAINTCSWGLV